MPDDLDNQLRAAMKTLDEQSPSGYFDALPNQILARLEDGSMQHGSGTPSVRDKQRDALTGPPVVAPAPAAAPAAAAKAERSEDSGLHDIRNLAQSTKQRLSKARDTQNPPIKDEDALASASGSWKNVALPQPARMVALPELTELPSKAELAAAEKSDKRLAEKTKQKAKKADKSESNDEVLAPLATANAALDAMSAKPAAFETRAAFSLPSQQNKRSKGPVLAILGLGMAAAAGGVIFMQMNKGDETQSAAATAAAPPVQADQAEAQKAPEPPPAPAAAPEVAAAGSAAPIVEPIAEEEAAEEPAEVAVADTKGKASKRGGKASRKAAAKEKDEPAEKPEVKVEEKAPDPKLEPAKKPKEGEGEPSFDALLKEAGVVDKKEVKPKLEKKMLSGDDFKEGMSGIASKAQGCYKGTQGTAMVKLTVAPSGKVTRVSVSGQFKGAPEGKCVESAVKSASFPPWDGGPQSFSYSYMLAD